MKVGLYFGSFNPIHIGHLIIASFVADNTDLDEIWFVVSPHNPLKKASTLLNEYHRLHLLRLAIDPDPRFRVSDIEFKLPKPSFTVDTLQYLTEKYPYSFSVIMGSDSFTNLPKWKNYQLILNNYRLLIYHRQGFEVRQAQEQENAVVLKAPMLEISSTYIRETIRQRKSISYLVPAAVKDEIEKNGYYLQ